MAPHRPADRGQRLACALTRDAGHAGCVVTLAVASVEPWSSATFSGSVITLMLTAPPTAALSAWLAALPERDVPLGRDIVADLAVEPWIADGDCVRSFAWMRRMDDENATKPSFST